MCIRDRIYSNIGFITPVQVIKYFFTIIGYHLYHTPKAFDTTVMFHHHPVWFVIDDAVFEQVWEPGRRNPQFIPHMLQIAVATFLARGAYMISVSYTHLRAHETVLD